MIRQNFGCPRILDFFELLEQQGSHRLIVNKKERELSSVTKIRQHHSKKIYFPFLAAPREWMHALWWACEGGKMMFWGHTTNQRVSRICWKVGGALFVFGRSVRRFVCCVAATAHR